VVVAAVGICLSVAGGTSLCSTIKRGMQQGWGGMGVWSHGFFRVM
jgi:hypothetical protein